MSNQGKIEELLLKQLQQEILSRNEICCKLRELITVIENTTPSTLYNGFDQQEINDGQSISVPGGSVHSLTLVVKSGNVDVELVGGEVHTYAAGSTFTITASTLIEPSYTFAVGTGKAYLIKNYEV